MVEVQHVLREAERRLTAAGTASPAADARLLLAHTLGVEPARLLVLDGVAVGDHQRFADLVAERAEGVPLQHLTGETTFRWSRLRIGPGAFVPRPETEVMTGWVLDRIREQAAADPTARLRVVDLCTGSGAIARAIWDETSDLHDRLELHALELADDAIPYAAANLAGTEVVLHHADVADAAELLRPDGATAFDVVVANPPYIPLDAYESVTPEVRDHDPMIALFSGDDGLDTIHVVAAVAARLLVDHGWLACEHAEVQSAAVQQLFARTGDYTEVRDRRDLTDRPRFLTARRLPRGPAPHPPDRPGSRRDADRTAEPASAAENLRSPLAGWTP